MKRCPQCGREYDLSMSFCLDDGAELLYGPASVDEPATAILSVPPDVAGGLTQPRDESEMKTAVPQPPATAGGSDPWRAAKALAALAVAVLVLVGGFFGYLYLNTGATDAINSIAVLPFENRSGSSDTDYLSDGLADSLIYRLSQLQNLKVSPTSSVMRYKGKEANASQIAQELNVDAVMSGRLVQIGDTLNISVQLVDARTEKLLWAEQYARKLSDLLATQREIASAIAERLQTRLTRDQSGITKKYTNSNEAYQLYLRGRHHWNKRTIDSLKAAAEHYNLAIEKDPTFSLAYAGLAETYVLYPNYEVMPAADSMPRAKAAALRALELDDSLAEAHTALAWYYATYEWDWAAGERGLRRAIKLNPNYGTAHQWLADLLAQTKRFDEALAAVKRSQESDPLSPVINFNVGWHYYLMGRHDDAIREYQRLLSLYPDFGLAHAGLCWAYERKGDPNAAIPSCRKAADQLQGSYDRAYLCHTLARAGQRKEAEAILAELKADAHRKYVTNMALAIAHAGLGDKETALDFLENEVNQRDYLASTFAVEPVLDGFRAEPRFKALLKKMNLPE
jgi:TolB-like protein/Flp pilus assembly protein TadD